MRPLIGVLYALGGAIAGLLLGLGGGTLFARIANITDREGAAGYFVIGVAILCALVGLVVGVSLFVRSAPAGEGTKQLVAAVLGLTALLVLLAGGAWSLLQMREAPLEYDGALATLEMELRFKTTELPTDLNSRWLSVEVHTQSTRPEGTPLPSRTRVEGAHTIIPVVQQPLYRAGRRTLVVRLEGKHTELYALPLKRTPTPSADWSDWLQPTTVEASINNDVPTPMTAVRYRVRRYGE